MAETATFNIPKDILEPIIQARVSAALAEVFSDKLNLIERIVNQVLTTRVEENGSPVSAHYQNDSRYKTTIEQAAHNALRDATVQAMKEAVAQNKELLVKAMMREMSRSNSKLVRGLCETMIAGLGKTLEDHKYRVAVSFEKDTRG